MEYKFGHDERTQFLKIEEISPKEKREYDVVVVGCGSAGIPCAVRLHELGKKVVIVQKEEGASCCGNFTCGIDLENSKKESLERVTKLIQEENGHKPKAEVINIWRDNSGEALKWILEKSKEANVKVKDLGDGPQMPFIKENDLEIKFLTPYFGPKPYNIQSVLTQILEVAVKDGLKVVYNSPAVKLVEENGKVKGVICKTKDGYVEYDGIVVLTTGDYQNDSLMLAHYLPQMSNFDTKKTGRCGDGHKMAMEIGGKMEMIGHTKMVHDMDSGPFEIMNLPYLRVKKNGKRFANEEIHMEYMNNYLLEDRGYYFEIFDSRFPETSEKLGSKVTKETLENFMPEVEGKKEGVVEELIATYKRDTLEELAEILEIEDKEEFLKTVENYNKMADEGVDREFGVKKENMTKVIKPPFYGVKRHVRLTMACSGICVDGRSRVLRKDDSPIEGVYAAGNLAGNFYGAHDYPLTIVGINLGRNITNGYQVANDICGK